MSTEIPSRSPRSRRSPKRPWMNGYTVFAALLTFLWVGFMIVRVVVGRGRRG